MCIHACKRGPTVVPCVAMYLVTRFVTAELIAE